MAASLRNVTQSGILNCAARQCQVLACAQYHGKVKVKKPQHYDRRVYNIITKPLYDDPPPYIKGSCRDPNADRNKVDDEVTPYEEFLIRQLRKEVEESRTFIICHNLPIIPPRVRQLKLILRSENIQVNSLSNVMMKTIIKDTKYANLEPLLVWNNARITSPDFKVKEILKHLKKYPEFHPIGGFVEDRLVSRADLIAISQMPDLDSQRGQLAAILNQVGGARTLSLLNHHQQKLSTNLEQLSKGARDS